MGRRGRRSGLTVIEGGIEYDPQVRLAPPADMTEPAAMMFLMVVCLWFMP
jgi:hypothetical protein